MKRSRSIRLVLIGTLSAGAVTSCGPGDQKEMITPHNVYTNNHYVTGAGYYHAPFRAWYPLPYNHFDSQNQRYFYGGQWATTPHESITNISPPTAQAAQLAHPQQTHVQRGGFGNTSRHHSTWS